MSQNLLSQETSPYLLQHAGNPVHWRGWNDAMLAEAASAGKPILLSVGYAACHWCHVMAHESFEDEATAAVMNELFVNVKVDREERPDLDSIYQTALALLGEQGGWPLTMFLTPKGEPFWGGTYFPNAPRFGRPAFKEVLQGIANTYRQDPGKIAQNVAAIRDALNKLSQHAPGTGITPELMDQMAQRLRGEIDPINGGIGGAPKFPQPSILGLLWRAWLRSGDHAYRHAVILTLTAMSGGGIYDHLGGGFARYSTDERWLVPHFEKMLYDNAQLIDLLTMTWQETRDPLFSTRLLETIGWVLREMVAPGHGFSSTIDADSEGHEGKFYVWTEAEIDALLGADAPAFKTFYDVTADGNWEGATILNRRAHTAEPDEATSALLARGRKALFEARAKRVKPGLDDKVLADWNGLMIAALARTATVFQREDWLGAARRAFAFVAGTMTKGGRLRHSFRDGKPAHPATLDDYANMARAALALHEATSEKEFLAQAKAWVAVLDKHYWDAAGAGYFLTADDTSDVIVRTKNASDNAVPSGNGTMVAVLARLFCLTGEEPYRARAEAIMLLFSGQVARNFFPLATLLNNAAMLREPMQVAVVGARDDAGAQALWHALNGVSLPDAVFMQIAPDAKLPPGHPAHGKGLVDGKPAAYVCRGPACSLPLTDPEALKAALQKK